MCTSMWLAATVVAPNLIFLQVGHWQRGGLRKPPISLPHFAQ